MAERDETRLSEVVHEARFGSMILHRAAIPSGRKLFEEALSLRGPLVDRSWELLSDRGWRCLGVGYGALRRLQSAALEADRLNAMGQRIAETFLSLFKFVAKSEKRSEFAQAMRDTLKRSDPKARLEAMLANRPPGDPPLTPEFLARLRAAVTAGSNVRIDVDTSLEALAQGKTKGVSLLVPFSPRAGEVLAREIDRTASFALLCVCRGLLAIVHAEFNLAMESQSRRSALMSSAGDKNDLSAIDRLVDDAERRMRQYQRAVYCALLTGMSKEGVADAGSALASDIERTLPRLARTQAAIRLVMLRLLEQGKGTAAEEFGRLGVRAGALTREALASHCAGYRLALSVLGSHHSNDVAAFLKRSERLPFASALPNGKNTTLKALGSSTEGEFVEIEGFVTTVEAGRQNDGKLISHLALLDPSSGATADAVAVFAHLPHAGITKGAFCRLSGVFRNRSALFENKPAVETDALSLGELANASWRIAFLRLAERWFHPWRNDMNLYWSLGPHGHADGGTEHFGAGELLFVPLVRR